MLKSGQVWAGLIVCRDATNALVTPSIGPAGVLYVNGIVNVAVVTVSGTNPYKWAVTLPALTAGDCLSMYITATIGDVATAAIVAEEVGDTALISDVAARILATAIAAYAGTPGTVGYLLSLLAGLDFTAVNLVAASNAGEIVIKRTLTLVAVVSGLTIPADWTACYWTVKRSVDHADADALVQVLVSNPPDAEDGLQVLMGTAVEDGSAGSLTVNQALGTVTIALDDASTAALEDAVELVWDVKVHAPAGKTQPGTGTATITTAVTRA